MLPLVAKTLAVADGSGGEVFVGGEVGEEEEHRQGIIEIAKGVGKGGVALLDEMVQGNFRLVVLLESLRIAVFATTERLLKLLCEGLVFAELGKDRLVEKVLDIFGLQQTVSSWQGAEDK